MPRAAKPAAAPTMGAAIASLELARAIFVAEKEALDRHIATIDATLADIGGRGAPGPHVRQALPMLPPPKGRAANPRPPKRQAPKPRARRAADEAATVAGDATADDPDRAAADEVLRNTIVEALRDAGDDGMAPGALRDECGAPQEKFKRVIAGLDARIVRVGTGRGTRWKLLSESPE